MSILFQCKCGKKLKVKSELAGKKVRCPSCQQELTIPVTDAAEPAGSPLRKNLLRTCPGCGKHVSETAVICISCGFNLKSGYEIQTRVEREGPSAAAGSAPSSRLTEGISQLAAKVAMPAILIAIVFGIYLWVSGFLAMAAVDGVFSKKGELAPEDFETAQGHLRTTIKYCNSRLDQGSPQTRSLRDLRMASIIAKTPGNADFSAFFALSPQYAHAREALIKRFGEDRKIGWLVDAMVDGDENTRELIQLTLASRLPQTPELQALVKEPGAESQAIQALLRKSCEDTLSGTFKGTLVAQWTHDDVEQDQENRRAVLRPIHTPRLAALPNIVSATPSDNHWLVKFAGKTWEGSFDDLLKMQLSVQIKDLPASARQIERIADVSNVALTLRVSPGGWIVEADSARTYSPSELVAQNLQLQERASRPDRGFFEVATFSDIRGNADGFRSGTKTVYWLRRGLPGFSNVELRLQR